ncbi:MerR family transcriptional regulator [Eubacterium oxidoreducens]|uniref:DNA-binding transcriptional regulator, MerR family n=1 Tax=Eubacterium oxidoreducens TaxID=1732 RepID=A0A1G6BWW7_EUBOX|nr:MerR family transcriptional regulator [Eubacterium oxidoreducens]SDB25095.1 DNA-binding transcriptional regulator, MerR family [Eubacterium oxidoreducens]
MNKDDTWLSISEMSNICRISRQTLIYYDKHDVFKPAYTDQKGYRFYSIYQVPYLREICALKDNDFSLKEIVDNFQNRTVHNIQDLLVEKKQKIEKEIETLQKKLQSIDDRLNYYKETEKEIQHIEQPYIKQFPERKILFAPWQPGNKPMDRSIMHYTHMKLRNRLNDINLHPDTGWGAMLLQEQLESSHQLKGAGGYVNLPDDFTGDASGDDIIMITVPGGFYACMSKYGMPYETQYVDKLNKWIHDNGYKAIGNLYDECLLDTTFYTEDNKRDFCQLRLPIQLPGVTF